MQERILKTDIMEIHRKGGGEMKTKKHNWKRWLPLYLMMAPGLIYIFINNYDKYDKYTLLSFFTLLF